MTGEKDPRDVMQAEHDARLPEHPAFQAPAEMPGVEEIHELLLKTQRSFQAERDAKLAGQGLWPDRSPAPLNVLARAILALFAPILAEKERRIAKMKEALEPFGEIAEIEEKVGRDDPSDDRILVVQTHGCSLAELTVDDFRRVAAASRAQE